MTAAPSSSTEPARPACMKTPEPGPSHPGPRGEAGAAASGLRAGPGLCGLRRLCWPGRARTFRLTHNKAQALPRFHPFPVLCVWFALGGDLASGAGPTPSQSVWGVAAVQLAPRDILRWPGWHLGGWSGLHRGRSCSGCVSQRDQEASPRSVTQYLCSLGDRVLRPGVVGCNQ